MALMSNSVTFSPAFSGWGKPWRDFVQCHRVDRAIWKCAQAALARAYWGFWSEPGAGSLDRIGFVLSYPVPFGLASDES
jgi:hypothetical protein